MGRIILKKIDRGFDLLVLLVVIGGGFVFHVATAFAVKGAFGTLWGVLAFVFPGGAEAVFSGIQLFSGDYKYTILLGVYVLVAAAKWLLWLCKNSLKRKLVPQLELVSEE